MANSQCNDSTTSCEFSVEEPGENKDDNQTLGQYYSINYYCKKGIVVLYATLSFHLECNYPQRLEIQQGSYGCACQWPCHQKGHKTEQVCRQDKGNITSKRASRVSHLATRFQSWWSSFSHSSIKYPIHQWYKLPACVLCLLVPCGQPNWQLLPTDKKSNCKYSIPCRSDGQAASVWTQILRTRGMRQARFSLFASLSKGSCFLLSLAIILRWSSVWTNALTQKSGFSAKNWQSSKC